jgi:large subunit ribosomal protein L6
MSNLGIKNIKIPSNLTIDKVENTLTIKGSFGSKNFDLHPNFSVDVLDNNTLKLYPKNTLGGKERVAVKRLWGTQYSLLKNDIIGLSQGYQKKLELVGVGFRATVLDNKLTLKLGYSHDVIFDIPSDVIIQCPKSDKLTVFGVSKQRVNEVITSLRNLKKIDPYKGKGILPENIQLRLKEGKKK